jgi:3-methyladenine DNA glycosylase/8-oxoguanine DNA glycosylase
MNKESAAALAQLEPEFGRLINEIGPIEFKKKTTRSPYEALVEAVVYQQLTAKAASTIFERLKALYPENAVPSPKELLETPQARFREAGLSRAKALAVNDIARKALDGTIPSMRAISKMSDEEIIEALIQIRGVGRWTAEMFLIFRLGRPDVFPITDYGIQKGFMKAFRKRKLPTPKQLASYGSRWEPYRTTAALYLWRAVTVLPE